MSKDNLLIVADSERDPDMLYAVRMFVPDPFVYVRVNGKCHALMSDLEIDRAKKAARHCRIHSLTQYQEELAKSGVKKPGLAHVIKAFLKESRLKKVNVPASFPHGLAKKLRHLGVKIKVSEDSCFPAREFKTPEEVKKISAALMMAEVGLSEGIQAIKRSKVAKNGRLVHGSAPLTSERLRAIIDTAIIQAGGLANHTIVACGEQACDPHEQGSGPIKANTPIILDVFPRSQKTGYFGDITRTVVKGRASEPVRRMFHTVAKAQEIAFKKIGHGARARQIHESVSDFFRDQKFETGKARGRMQGFFHGTGHGVGLEIHEAPRIGRNSPDILQAGHVITIEPGLYYPGIGGVRLEDMALVGRGAPKNLTKFEKILEL